MSSSTNQFEKSNKSKSVVIMELNDEGNVATLWLNRPEKRNALNYAIFSQLAEYIDKIASDKKIRVVLLKAKGPHFSSGIDIGLLSGQDPTAPKFNITGQEFRYLLNSILQPLFTKITLLEKPVIAVLQDGICYGSGFELALACDFRFVMKKTDFQMLESRLGIIPDLGGTTRLCRLVNPSQAKEIILAARSVKGDEAFRMGFVNGVASTIEEQESQVQSLVNNLLKSAPLAVGTGKRLIDEIYCLSEPSALRQEGVANASLFKTKDFGRAISAWLERKEPKWKGN